MSRYVQRCRECRQVRGNTSFRLLLNGGRVAVCRWCEDMADHQTRTLMDLQRQIAAKRKERTALQAKVDRNGMELAALRSEASSLVTGRITAEAS